jgi:hypothetical protein
MAFRAKLLFFISIIAFQTKLFMKGLEQSNQYAKFAFPLLLWQSYNIPPNYSLIWNFRPHLSYIVRICPRFWGTSFECSSFLVRI